jgi:hypothetical protein
MVQIILLAIGITALFKKNIAVTKTTELRQPKLKKFGIITISMVILAVIFDAVLPEGTDLGIFSYVLTLLIPIIAAVKLKEPITGTDAVKK